MVLLLCAFPEIGVWRTAEWSMVRASDSTVIIMIVAVSAVYPQEEGNLHW